MNDLRDLLNRLPDGFELHVEPDPARTGYVIGALARLGIPSDPHGTRRRVTTLTFAAAFVDLDWAVDEAARRIEP